MKRVFRFLLICISVATMAFVLMSELTADWDASQPKVVVSSGSTGGERDRTIAANLTYVSRTHDFRQKVESALQESGISYTDVTVNVERSSTDSSVIILSVTHNDPKNLKKTLQTVDRTLEKEVASIYGASSGFEIRAIDRISYQRNPKNPLWCLITAAITGLLAALFVEKLISMGVPASVRRRKITFLMPSLEGYSGVKAPSPFATQPSEIESKRMKPESDRKRIQATNQQAASAVDKNAPEVDRAEIVKEESETVLTQAPSIADSREVETIETIETKHFPTPVMPTVKTEAAGIVPAAEGRVRAGVPSNLPTTADLPEYLKAMMGESSKISQESPEKQIDGTKDLPTLHAVIPDTKGAAVEEPSEAALKERLNRLLRGEL